MNSISTINISTNDLFTFEGPTGLSAEHKLNAMLSLLYNKDSDGKIN